MTSQTPPMLFATATAGMPAVRDTSATWRQFMGIPDGNVISSYNSMADYGRAPADEAWVYRCVSILAFGAQSVPLKVYVRSGKERIPVDEAGDEAGQALQFLLDDVNPVNMSGSDLKAYTIAGLAVWGENYWQKVRGRFGGTPQELYWLRAPDIRPQIGRTWVDSYDYHPSNGDIQSFAPRDVVPFRTINLQDPTRGLSPLAAVRNEITVNRQATLQNASVLANWGIPAGAWVAPKDAGLTPTDQSMIKRALRALRGPQNQGKVPILPQGLDWKPLALNPKDAEWLAARKVSRMTICAALGVPLVLAGDDEKTTVYANLRDAERVMWRLSLIPRLDWYADVVNSWLVPDFDKTRRRLVVGFDYTGIEALAPTWEAEWNAWLGGVGAQVIVPNEFRRHFRIGVDVPWGDAPAPDTKITLRPDPTAVPAGTMIAEDPSNVVALPPAETEPAQETDNPPNALVALRAYGKSLYAQPAVKAWIADVSRPLAVRTLLGQELPVEMREAIQNGLRHRHNAAHIADGLLPEDAGVRAAREADERMERLATRFDSAAERIASRPINLDVPAAQVTIAEGAVRVDSPVTVHLPSGNRKVVRDKAGAITGLTED